MTDPTKAENKGSQPGGVSIGNVKGSIINSIVAGGNVEQKNYVCRHPRRIGSF